MQVRVFVAVSRPGIIAFDIIEIEILTTKEMNSINTERSGNVSSEKNRRKPSQRRCLCQMVKDLDFLDFLPPSFSRDSTKRASSSK